MMGCRHGSCRSLAAWALALAALLAACAGVAGGDVAAATLLHGANLCVRGPSSACCGLLNSALGDPDNPIAK
jgi:hypothetical protein